METASKEKITIALIGLCFVIGVMSLLSVVYYTQAADTQNRANAQVAALQAQQSALQQQVQQRDTTITNLNTQLTNLATENQNLNTQVNYLNAAVDDFAFRAAHLEAPNVIYNPRVGTGMAHRN